MTASRTALTTSRIRIIVTPYLLTHYVVSKHDDHHGHHDHSGDTTHGVVSNALLRGFYTLSNKDNSVVPVNLEQT